MSILLQKPGLLTTLQDLGRRGFRRFGINPGGAMDGAAARLINTLIGNGDAETVLEMHFPAPQIIFEANAFATIGGADFSPVLDGEPVENWRPFFAKKGSILKFGGKIYGNRAYLAVRGGFKADEWLGSSSTNLAAKVGGFRGRKLGPGDRIRFKQRSEKRANPTTKRIASSIIPFYSSFPTVRVIAGAEFEYLSADGRGRLLNQDFTISNDSNRMGFRLSGEPVSLAKPREFISSSVSFGTIQILPNGQLIVLMADHQTAGGYPRIAHAITRDLPLLAQLGATDKVAFHLVDNQEAEDLAMQFEKELRFLRVGAKLSTDS